MVLDVTGASKPAFGLLVDVCSLAHIRKIARSLHVSATVILNPKLALNP